MTLAVEPVPGLPEVGPGDDLAALLAPPLAALTWPDGSTGLSPGDIVVVTSKVVSKAEGRVVQAADREQAITDEAVRVVATRGATRIVETRHGLVMAAAGVDASNVAAGTVALLPLDPDASARALRAQLVTGLDVAPIGVVVTDTLGRPWRLGLTDAAIGAAGVVVLDDHRGRTDAAGHALEMTVTAVADEIAAAAGLLMGQAAEGLPAVLIRGLRLPPAEGRATDLVRPPELDLYR